MNRVVWSPKAVDELSAAVVGVGPGAVAHLVRTLEDQLLCPGRGHPEPDEVKELFQEHLRVVYRLTGVGTTIEVLEVRPRGSR